MAPLSDAFVFFDIGDTLASVSISGIGHNIKVKMTPLQGVLEVLMTLKAEGAHLGILSNNAGIPVDTVNQSLDQAGLFNFFEPQLILYGSKDSPALFKQAIERIPQSSGGIDVPSSILLFVGESAAERAQAKDAGFLIANQPALVLKLLLQQGGQPYLRRLNEELGEHEKSGDSRFFQRYLANDLIFRRADGSLVDKQKFLNDLTANQFEVLESSVNSVEVTNASAVVDVKVKAKRVGQSAGEFWNIRVFQLNQEGWQLRIWVNTKIRDL